MRNYLCLKEQEVVMGEFKIVPIRHEDRCLIRQWRNEQLYHLRQSKPITEEDQEKYFSQVVAKLFNQDKPDQLLFSFLRNDVLVGYGGLVHINWLDKNAEISFIMDTRLEAKYFDEYWFVFMELLESIAFEELSFNKIMTYAFDFRPRIYEIFEAIGFIKEAHFKNHARIKNGFVDVIIHSKLSTKYNSE